MSLLDDLAMIMALADIMHDRDPSFLTNFGKDQLMIYHQAITKDMIDNDPAYSLEIRNDAYDVRGNRVDSCYALHLGADTDREDLDLSNFWRIFDGIKKDAQAAVK